MIKDINAITPEYMKHRIEEETQQYKQEIKRLTKQNKALNEMYELTKKEYIRLNNIIKEVREYIYNNSFDEERKEIIDELWVNEIKDILEILDKGE